jgi:hypothetical protein
MPGYDGTGPEGKGPMTGRGMGYCATEVKDQQEVERPRRPLRLGRGWGGPGRGLGRRNRFRRGRSR